MSSKTGCNARGDDKKHGFLKILIPSVAVGALIGPKGRTITQLQEDTQTKVEISHRKDYYPGTTERTCLVSGSRSGVLRVLQAIIKVINRNPFVESSPCMHHHKRILYGRRQQIKILIPDHLVVRMIKFKRRVIKEIELRSGSYVHLSPVSGGSDCERCITVAGDEEDNLSACLMIFDRIINHQTGNDFRQSYAHARNRVLGFRLGGSPCIGFQNLPDRLSSRRHELPTANAFHVSRNLPDNIQYPLLQTVSTNTLTIDWDHFLSILQVMLANSMLPAEAIESIKSALSTLNSYGVLDLCLQILINDFPPPGEYPFHEGNPDMVSLDQRQNMFERDRGHFSPFPKHR